MLCSMALRPKHIYNRLNRARLDSMALQTYRRELIRFADEVRDSHAAWQEGTSPAELRSCSQRFIDYLSEIFLVPPKALSLIDRARPHGRDKKGRVRSELYGSCASQGNIRIYLRTAARAQPSAFKTYFNTLVHEWVHHYDFEALRDTVHCAGFYQRVKAIYDLCLQKEERACP